MAHKTCYDYSKTSDGSLVIYEKEARVVRLIFEYYLAGDSLGKIVDVLAEKKLPLSVWQSKMVL